MAQYADEGQDIATEYTPEQALQPIKKYIARYGQNVRKQEQERDFLKIAHYAQIAWLQDKRK